MDLAEAYAGPMVDAIYRRLMNRDSALDDPEVVMLLAAYRQRGVLDRPNMRVMGWRNEPGLGNSRTYQPGEMPLPTKLRPGMRRMHQEMNSEAASSSSQLRAAEPLKRARVEEEIQTHETMQDLNGMIEELEKTRKELDEMTKTILSTEEDRDIWKRVLED